MSLTGGHHFVYDPLRPHIGPTRWFGGHTGGTRGRAALPVASACSTSMYLSASAEAWQALSVGPTQPSPLLLCPSPSSPHSCTAATHHLPAPAVASFYVKAAWSPDGSHIISGSTDRSVYIWEVGWGLQLWCPFQCSSWLLHHVPHAGMVWSRRRPVHGCSSNVQLSLPRLSIAQLPPSPLTGGCPRRRLAVRAAGPPGRGDCGGLVPLRFPAGPRLGCV